MHRALALITTLSLLIGSTLANGSVDENLFDEFPEINKFSVFHSWKEFAIEKKCEWMEVCPIKENSHLIERGFPEELNCPKDDEKGCGFCNATRDCNNHGICSDANYCICDDEHWKENCQATRKNELTAFLLTLLVGPIFGLPPCAGRFYMGYTGIAVAQLLLGCAGLMLLIFPYLFSFMCCSILQSCIR